MTEATPATATATVKTSSGTAVSGTVVSFSTSGGLGALSAPSSLTDANGQATVVLRPVTAAAVGADNLVGKVTVSGTEYSGQVAFQINGSNPATISLALGSSTLRPGSQTPVTATVRTPAGAAVAGAIVEFKSSLGSAQLSATSAVTNTDGQASVNATAAQGVNGADSIIASATIKGTAISASANVQLGTASVGTLTLAMVSEVGSGQAVPVVATLNNAAGTPIAGAIVRFRSLGGLASTDRPSDVTSSAGTASANVSKSSSSTVGADQIEASATISGVELIATKTIRLTSASPAAPRISFVMPSDPVTSTQPREATLQVLKGDGMPAANLLVQLGTTQNIGKTSKPTDLTDSNGLVRVQLQAASPVSTGADELQVTATVEGVTVTAREPFRVNAIATGQLALALVNNAGVPVTTVSSGSPATVNVTLTNESGAPVPGLVVSFSTLLGFGQFSTPTALTNSNGLAVVQLRPVTAQTSGADTVVARATLNGTPLTVSKGFQLTATNVSISDVQVNPPTLGAYAQADVIVSLSGNSASDPVSVTLNSTCIGEGKATLTPTTVTSTESSVRFTYRDNGCGAVRTQDTLQISVTGTSANSTRTVGLTSPSVSAINFTSATPSTIFLKGSGYTENSSVRFQIKDANGNGLPGRCAEFELSTLAGGLLLEDQPAPISPSYPIRRKSDANGDYVVRVNSGTVPTPVRVKATLVDGANDSCVGGTLSNIATVSSNLSVAVGLPAQLNFSLSQGTINIEGYDRDGATNTYSVIASDRLGNPVPEGTSINFVTESGQVQPVRFTAIGNDGLSRATANFISSEPRPRDGRITILAYALGEKSFLDLNGNNQFDTNEPFQDLADIFLDRLYNVQYNTAANQLQPAPNSGFNSTEDQVISLTLPGASLGTCVAPQSGLLALSTSIPSRSEGVRCTVTNSTRDLRAYVRRAVQTILSTSSASPMWGTRLPSGSYAIGSSCPSPVTRVVGYNGDDSVITTSIYPFGSTRLYGQGTSNSLSFFASDANDYAFNPVAAGTVITAAATNGLSVSVAGGSPVASTSSPTGAVVNFKFDDTTFTGTITVTFTSPAGLGTSFSQFVGRDAAPGGSIACP
ncbi:MAG: hypothetical protein ACK5O3_07195 [Burkholderiales bacterium]